MPEYPRDMHGYGESPPDPEWPGGARVAVQFVVNYEEGGEHCVLHGDDASEAFLSEIVGAVPWPNQRHWNMESIYEYGARSGFWRLHRLFTGQDIPITVFGVATALARGPAQVRAMLDAGWEIASHGLKWTDYRDCPEDEERCHIEEAVRLHHAVTGEHPRGWYTGRCSANTVRLVARHGGFEYIADSYADDLPYWIEVGDKDQLIIPYTLDANDMRFATPQGFNTGDDFFRYLKDSLAALHAEGRAGRPGMLSVGLHCRLAGRPGRIEGLKRFIEYAREHEGVWFARRVDIARHWHEHFPHRRMERPSTMNRDRFVALFGRVFEHSAWIAERACDLEQGPAHNTAVGVHSLLVRVFRQASAEERLGVLKAHPDLAGKLAQARRLTAESTGEQASAGLDALTDDERTTFGHLNEQYTARHGFPFIIAVRDYDKQGILLAFQARIGNDRATEFREACRQVERIAELRLKELLP